MSLKTALIQQQCAADPQRNIAATSSEIRRAAAAGARLVLLQELHNSRYFCQTEDPAHFERHEERLSLSRHEVKKKESCGRGQAGDVHRPRVVGHAANVRGLTLDEPASKVSGSRFHRDWRRENPGSRPIPNRDADSRT